MTHSFFGWSTADRAAADAEDALLAAVDAEQAGGE